MDCRLFFHGTGVIHVIAYELGYLEGHLKSSSFKYARPEKLASKSVLSKNKKTRSISTVFCVTSVFGRDRQNQFQKLLLPKTFPRIKLSTRFWRKSLIFAFFKKAVF